MSRAEAAAMDRLPWLQDEPEPQQAKRRGNALSGSAAAAIVAVAGGGFWMGARAVQEQPAPASRNVPPSTTVRLPELRPAEPQVRMPLQSEVRPAAQPQVRPARVRDVTIGSPSAPSQSATSAAPKKQVEQAPARAPIVGKPQPHLVIARPRNQRTSSGAAGRLVQIGAFGSVRQAKLGRSHVVRSYPAMAHLPTVVRRTRNSRGRIFYRIQAGTTSQADSEVLCQRLQQIRLSCTVVGLPSKSRGQR
jgi:SPOR domain